MNVSPQALVDWVATLDADAREFFAERAAILEYEAGLSRQEAEARAQQLTGIYQQRREAEQAHPVSQGNQEARHVPD